MGNEKNYMERRFDTMKRQTITKGSSAGMVLRVVFLIVTIFLIMSFINWSVKKSCHYFTDEELYDYYQEKHVIIYNMKKRGLITERQFQQMKDSIKTNAKRDFIIERR